jgi:hypothetical protein
VRATPNGYRQNATNLPHNRFRAMGGRALMAGEQKTPDSRCSRNVLYQSSNCCGSCPVLTTLFDKSFLQSLSVDESVWFDQHFMPVVCPVFYVETLADLAKQPTERGLAENEVRNIAAKFPKMRGYPVRAT